VLAVDGVSSEPFSGPNSLLTGKNTGKFANFAPKVLLAECFMTLNPRKFLPRNPNI